MLKLAWIRSIFINWIIGPLAMISALLISHTPVSQANQLPTSTPTPASAYNPLAIPTLPENPSQAEMGEYLYYFNCMPCHGDKGQGLTDAWRQVWEEDHRNCWGRGCHGGYSENEGFPIPKIVPAIILEGDALGRFSNLEDLFIYLKATHPPQEPGRLADEDYQALVAFLWAANNKTTIQATATALPTPQVEKELNKSLPPPPCGLAGLLIIGLLGALAIVHRKGLL